VEIIIVLIIVGAMCYFVVHSSEDESNTQGHARPKGGPKGPGPKGPIFDADYMLMGQPVAPEQKAWFIIGMTKDRQNPRCEGPVITHADGGIECLGCNDPLDRYHGEEHTIERCAPRHFHQYTFACERCSLNIA
jgi:hypothetical protein